MEHKNCCLDSFEKIRKTTCDFEIRQDLAYFLLNIILNLKQHRNKLCYCIETDDYVIGEVDETYANYGFELYRNMLSLDFLAACHSNMYLYHLQLFKYDNHLTCLLLFNEYQYKHVDWFIGKEYQIPLSDAILFQGNKMVDNI